MFSADSFFPCVGPTLLFFRMSHDLLQTKHIKNTCGNSENSIVPFLLGFLLLLLVVVVFVCLVIFMNELCTKSVFFVVFPLKSLHG